MYVTLPRTARGCFHRGQQDIKNYEKNEQYTTDTHINEYEDNNKNEGFEDEP